MTCSNRCPVPTTNLSGDIPIPSLGFGTFQLKPDDTQGVVEMALEAGYRHIDTAAAYYNERGVGQALAATGLADKVFVTSKLRNVDQGTESVKRAFDSSINQLGLDQIDLYLIHWPVPSLDRYVDTWRTMIDLRETGCVRAVGVCNFMSEHLERLMRETGKLPCINQVESHPMFWRPQLDEYCSSHGIVVEAYSPLGQGADLESPTVREIAGLHNVTPAQVVLRWHVQKGHVAIPKTTHGGRMHENLSIFGFELTPEQMARLDAMDSECARCGNDPYTCDAPQTLEDMRSRGRL